MTTRSDKYTIERSKREHFSDFLTNLDRNPVTGYLARAVDRQAIEISLRNIILTNRGEWPFESAVGSKIRASLFELGHDPRDFDEIRNSISEAIRMLEPRVDLVDLGVNYNNTDFNRLYVSIYYTILNIPSETFQFDIAISRVR